MIKQQEKTNTFLTFRDSLAIYQAARSNEEQESNRDAS
jgi:hypothetical protein